MFEVLSRHYSEIKTPIDYLGETKYQEETATINTANIEKFRESETGKLYVKKRWLMRYLRSDSIVYHRVLNLDHIKQS
jgi:hypothetical protein